MTICRPTRHYVHAQNLSHLLRSCRFLTCSNLVLRQVLRRDRARPPGQDWTAKRRGGRFSGALRLPGGGGFRRKQICYAKVAEQGFSRCLANWSRHSHGRSGLRAAFIAVLYLKDDELLASETDCSAGTGQPGRTAKKADPPISCVGQLGTWGFDPRRVCRRSCIMVHSLPKADGLPRFQMLSWIWVGCLRCR